MSAVLLIIKTIMLIGFAVAIFYGMALGLGVDAAPSADAVGCGAKTPQFCLFTII